MASVPGKLSLGGQLLADPVLERSDLLDVLLLGGILLLRRDIDLLLLVSLRRRSFFLQK